MPYKIDLHTHSTASIDGSISAKQYKEMIQNGKLDYIAVTDHNRIDFAQKLQREMNSDTIIVGEEISTKQGDIIGLYLNRRVKPDQDIKDTISDIKSQGGLLYIPHPFETVRKGISHETLDNIIDDVDIIESANGRAFFQNFGPDAHVKARFTSKRTSASSDAHRSKSLGKTYTIIDQPPTKDTLLIHLLKAKLIYERPSILDILSPKINRFAKLFRGRD